MVVRRRPDLLEVLYRPMCWDMNGQEAPGAAPYFELAPCFEVDGAPRFFYIGWYIRDAQRHPQVPRLTDDQLAAMALVEAVESGDLERHHVAIEIGWPAHCLAGIVDDEVQPLPVVVPGQQEVAEGLDARRVAQVETEDLEPVRPRREIGRCR